MVSLCKRSLAGRRGRPRAGRPLLGSRREAPISRRGCGQSVTRATAPHAVAECTPGTLTHEVSIVRDGDTIELDATAIRLSDFGSAGMGRARRL